MTKKKSRSMLSAFSIILILIFALGIISNLLPEAKFVGNDIVNGSGTVGATLSDILMSPILGFESAIDVSIFVMVLGGFLAIINKKGKRTCINSNTYVYFLYWGYNVWYA